jgi:membrane-bound ClpP family serine protease
MVDWITVVSLILFGLVLIIVEIIFVPGTTVVGLVGFIFMAIGVALSFRYFGTEIGWSAVGATGVASGALLYLSFKSNLWGRFALKSTSQGKLNEGEMNELFPGQEGVTVSALRPVGKAELLNRLCEVKTLGEYVDAGKRIRILKILSNQIIVEPIN